VLDEPICELGNVHETILVYAYVDKGAKGRHVRHDSFEHHVRRQVTYFRHLLLEAGRLELGSWIAAWLRKLGQYVAQRVGPYLVGAILVRANAGQPCLIADQVAYTAAGSMSHSHDQVVALRVDSGGVQGV